MRPPGVTSFNLDVLLTAAFAEGCNTLDGRGAESSLPEPWVPWTWRLNSIPSQTAAEEEGGEENKVEKVEVVVGEEVGPLVSCCLTFPRGSAKAGVT